MSDAVNEGLDLLRRELAEKDRAIADLRKSLDDLAQVIEITDTGVAILDEQGNVLVANPRYARLAGHADVAQILGRCVVEWTAEHDRARTALAVRQCLEQGSVRDLVVDYVDLAGRITPVEIDATMRRASGVTEILTICRDATGRRQAEAALGSSVQQYRATIDAMGAMIHVVDPQLRIVLMNRQGFEWTGELGLGGDVLGKTVFEAFPFLPDRVKEEYFQVLETAEPLITEEQSIVGHRRIVTETRKIPIVENGAVARVVTVVRDVTAMAQAQEQLRQSEKMEALGQLAGGIAHDFNNHISAMLGCAEVLQQRLQDPALRVYAETVAHSAMRSSELTQKLMAFAHKAPHGTDRIDVHRLVVDQIAMLARTMDPRIEILHRLDADPHVVMGDAGQLENALLNLALNARDAMPGGGRLVFSTQVVADDGAGPQKPGAPGLLRICVEDTGTGMGEETLKRLFEPFFTTKDPGQGTGMGLASVYATVTRHDGTIRVSSVPGQGSVFTIELPLASA